MENLPGIYSKSRFKDLMEIKEFKKRVLLNLNIFEYQFLKSFCFFKGWLTIQSFAP